MCNDHFAGDLGKIDLIPVEKGDMAEEREEKDDSSEDYEKINY